MPGSFGIIEELQRRVQSRDGYFLLTCTPKVKNDEIRKLIDASCLPYSKKYQLLMFDNPVLSDNDKEKILAELNAYPEAYRNTVLRGDWAAGEQAVYNFNPFHRGQPKEYHRGWRHILAVDPAMASKMGLTLWAEDPKTGIWYCIKSEYLSNLSAPDDYVRAAEAKVVGYNIVRRISDTESWYIGAASKLGYTYLTVYNKAQRKNELIKNLQTALDKGEIKIPEWNSDLIDEFITCHWSETTEGKIVGSQRFHLLDCCQYFVDLRPAAETLDPNSTFADRIVEAHFKHKKAQSTTLTHGGRLSRRRRPWKRSQAGSSLRY
jgi:hypothetical protein